jgi:hypothetical protein
MDRGKRLHWRRLAAGRYRYGPYVVTNDGPRQMNGGLGWKIQRALDTRFDHEHIATASTLKAAKVTVEADAKRRGLYV